MRLFINMFRFIDKLCATKNHLEFDRNFKSIYLSELQLKNEKMSTSVALFLDSSIIIEIKTFKIQFNDKRDAFPFSVVLMQP